MEQDNGIPWQGPDEEAKLIAELAAKRTSLGIKPNGERRPTPTIAQAIRPAIVKVDAAIERRRKQLEREEEAYKRRRQEQAEKAERYKLACEERRRTAPLRKRDSVWQQLVESRGPRYAKASFENYVTRTREQQAAKQAAMDYAKNAAERIAAGQNVLFIGTPGTGKDHLMIAMAHEAIGKLKTLIWVNGSTLWMKFRESIGKEPRGFSSRLINGVYDDRFDAEIRGTESEITAKLCTVDVLAISNPCPPGGALTDFQANNLFTIIERRYSDLRPTWMTINVANRAEAESRLGGSTVDRMGHDALVITCDWPSYRQKQEPAT